MEVFKTVFGFMISQPLHVTLRQMRLIQVSVIINSQMLLWYICELMITLDSTQAAIGLSSVMVLEVAAIWKCVDSLRLGNVKDQGNE